MKIAIPEWQGRVSPVFDVAAHILLADVDNGQIVEKHVISLGDGDVHARAAELVGMGVDVLICGAISKPLEMILSGAGVEVISQTCGETQVILTSFAANRLNPKAFLMPGCGGRHRRRHGQRRRGRPDEMTAGRTWHEEPRDEFKQTKEQG